MIFLRSLALASLLALLATAQSPSSRAQEDAITVFGLARLDVQSNSVIVDVRVNTTVAVSAFQFLLVFDPGVLRLRSMTEGAFLQSSEQDPVCDKTIEAAAVRVECALPVSAAARAPSGLGALARLDFEPLRQGDARLTLSRVVLRGADGSVVAAKVQQANFAVDGAAPDNRTSRWRTVTFLIVGGGLAAVVLALGGYLLRAKGARRAVE